MSGQVGYGLFAERLDRSTVAVRHGDYAHVWAPAIALAGVLAVALLWFPLLRATAPSAITYNEGWNVYWQEAAASGRGLYVAPPWLTIANYPPLSFHLIGMLGALAGDTNLAGRVVALVSLGLVCVLAGMIAARFSGSRLAGWYAGLCPLVWLAVFSPIRIAMNDPQWLGMVPELLGFYVCLRRPMGVSDLCGAAVLFALAVFTKDNLIAVPVAVGLNLVVAADWRRLAIFVSAGIAASCVLMAATFAIDGGFFLQHVLHARAVSYEAAQHTIMTYGLFFPPAIMVGATWSAQTIGVSRYRLLALGWMAANVLGIAMSFGHGVANNILFEALVMDAIVVTVACQTFLEQGQRRRSAFLLMLNAVWPVVLLPAALTDGPREWDMLPRSTVAFQAGADAVRVRQGPAWCEDLLLCHAAGKLMVFDAYFTQDQIKAGLMNDCVLVRRLVAQEPASVEIGAPSDRRPVAPEARLRFTAPVMRTLLTYYAPVVSLADVTVLARSYGPWVTDEACA